jgi:hypothetical protein
MGVAGLWDGLVVTPTKKTDGLKKAKAQQATLTGASTGSVKRQPHTNCPTMRFEKPLDSQIPRKLARPKRRARHPFSSSSCFFFYFFCCGVPEMSPVVDDGLNTSGGIHDLRQSTMRMPTRSELYRFFCLTVIDRTTSLFTKVSFRT